MLNIKNTKCLVKSDTNTGKVRKQNEDRAFVSKEEKFFAVIDGMGGLACGLETAEYIANNIQKYIPNFDEISSDEDACKMLKNSICKLSDDVFNLGNKKSAVYYGATIVSMLMSRDCVTIASLGDCRCYHITDNTIQCVTEDHSVVGMLVQSGKITEQEALVHPSRNRVTQYVGMSNPLPCVKSVKFKKGDTFVLCSDGLWSMVDKQTILEMVKNSNDNDDIAKDLVKCANQNGGKDNITVIVVSILDM